MNARTKLNAAYMAGSVAVAGVLGAVTNSWWIFGLVLIVSIGINLSRGEIRPPRG
jgi:hypothetical protein